jgi:branched-chain amino acid transport system permease protein
MAKKVIIRGTAEYRKWMFLGLGVALALAVALPYVLSTFRTFQFTMALIWAVAVLGLNLLTGYSGQISLGHSAFFGVGAYTTSILVADYGWHHLLTLPVAAALAFIAGFAVGLPALRLAGLYLALMTLALAVSFPALARRFDGLTDGVMGKSIRSRDVNPPSWLPFTRDEYLYFLALTVLIIMLVLARNMVKSRVGRALTALRDNEIPAQTLAVYPARYKTLAFAISASYAGVAGGLYALVIRYSNPQSFLLTLSILILAGMVVGGLATVGGAIIGGIFIQFVPYYAEEVNKALGPLIFGFVIIVTMLVAPGGLVSLLKRGRNRFFVVTDPPVTGAAGQTATNDSTAGASA